MTHSSTFFPFTFPLFSSLTRPPPISTLFPYTTLFRSSNWTTIDNNVPSTSRLYSWVVPATVTNNALIRVSRNGTALTGQSNFNFSVLGQPTLLVTKACEGAVQLNWGAVAGATSYDILQLTADSMRVI